MGHVGPQQDKTTGIRTPELWEEWRQQCPVTRFEELCKNENWLSQSDMDSIRKTVQEEIDAAFEFTKNSEDAVWLA